MDEHRTAHDAHVVIDKDKWREADSIKASVKRQLVSEFGLAHTTLELECAVHACEDPAALGGPLSVFEADWKLLWSTSRALPQSTSDGSPRF